MVQMKIKKNKEEKSFLKIFIITLVSIVIFSLLTFAYINNKSNNSKVVSKEDATGNLAQQIVNVRVEGSQYIMQPSQLKIGTPTKLIFDMSTVRGCARSVILPEFGVRKMLSNSDNSIDFLPMKQGNFKIACSMNMYTGQFSVN